MNGDGFLLREVDGTPFYSCKAFERVSRLRHGFSTRHGGVPAFNQSSLNLSHSSWDSPGRVRENQRKFLLALRLESALLATLHQVHSCSVHIIDDYSGQGNHAEGDALVTGLMDVALAVRTADCVPVLIVDPVKRAAAAVHSGWRGTIKEVLPETIRTLQQVFGSAPADLLIAAGPGIRVCCFEVGPEVADLFDAKYPGAGIAIPPVSRQEKYRVDLYRALELQLERAGVRAENCHDLGACTCCGTDRFFSYRAEGSASGRMMAAIGFSS